MHMPFAGAGFQSCVNLALVLDAFAVPAQFESRQSAALAPSILRRRNDDSRLKLGQTTRRGLFDDRENRADITTPG
jgi:hypothetical protein